MSNPTTPFGWQMPTNTDLVTDLPADFEVFGQAVATDLQYLLGGTTGQVLKKDSNTDLDFVWAADSAGMTNPMTTTGDVIYSSPGSTPVRLGIGTANQVLRVNSGATAPEWATPAASGGMTLIQETVANADTTIAFSSISGSYKQLLLVWTGIYHSTTGSNFDVRINGDTGSNYYTQQAGFANTGPQNEQNNNTTIGSSIYTLFGSNQNQNDKLRQARGMLLIDNYASSTKNKFYQAQNTCFYNAGGGYIINNFLNGQYASNTAITSLDIVRLSGSATFSNDSNTSIRLYGIA